MTNSVQIPDSSSPVNYSGTQINFWGCAPNIDPGNWLKQSKEQNQPYNNPYHTQLGAMTNQMIHVRSAVIFCQLCTWLKDKGHF